MLPRRFVWLLVLSSGLAAAPAAAEDEVTSRFRHLVDEATAAFQKGEFERAADLAAEAYAIRPDARLLYNLARAKEAAGDAAAALHAYRRYLASDAATDREVVLGRIKALEARVADAVRLQAERDEIARRSAAAVAGYRRFLELRPDARERPEIERRIHALEHPAPPPAARTAGPATAGPLPWILFGVGAATVGAGAVFGVVSRYDYEDANGAANGADAADRRDDGDRNATIANVTFAAGGALAVGGIVWLLLRQAASEPSSATRLVPGRGSVHLRGSF